LVTIDFGKERKLPLKGLDDKAIEQQVSDLVQRGS
jgi:NADH dehydrogenase (ubiquinone) 1 alpha subcomplex subunit 2